MITADRLQNFDTGTVTTIDRFYPMTANTWPRSTRSIQPLAEEPVQPALCRQLESDLQIIPAGPTEFMPAPDFTQSVVKGLFADFLLQHMKYKGDLVVTDDLCSVVLLCPECSDRMVPLLRQGGIVSQPLDAHGTGLFFALISR